MRNLALLTTPIDTDGGLYTSWIRRDSFDPGPVTDAYPSVPGRAIDFANKMMKPVTNYWTHLPPAVGGRAGGQGPARAPTSPWPSGWRTTRPSPAAPSASGRPGCTRRTASWTAACACAASASTSATIEQNLLVVTAGADHIAPPPGTRPLLDLVSSEDVTHFDRPGGHIGLMAGSKAREEIWPDIVEWLDARSDR